MSKKKKPKRKVTIFQTLKKNLGKKLWDFWIERKNYDKFLAFFNQMTVLPLTLIKIFNGKLLIGEYSSFRKLKDKTSRFYYTFGKNKSFCLP